VKILVYSETSAANLQSRLGTAEYSYYFVLREFMPVLQSLGDVQVIQEPAREVDPIFLACREAGQPCVFLSFSPPHRTCLDLQCPTIPVFAWEFDSIPHESWLGRAHEDWSWAIRQLGRAITHSESTVVAARRVLEPSYPLVSIPAPVWDSFAAVRATAGAMDPRVLIHGKGALFDSAELDPHDFLRADPDVWHSMVHGTPLPPSATREQEGKLEEPKEQQSEPETPLPALLGRDWWRIGKRYAGAWYELVISDFLPGSPRGKLACRDATAPVVHADNDVSDLPETAHLKDEDLIPLFQARPFSLALQGVVFTSVFNPYDGRKNWADLLSAFCSAFTDNQDATLLFKLTHHACTSAIVEMQRHLARLPQFRCRVVLLHGYLADAEYQELVKATAYVVNASLGEGQCLPLMEFLSCGKPAIAPAHSGMSDYINDQLAFVVDSWAEATGWPHDPRFATRTCRQQISWTSLREAFRQAYATYREDPATYKRMAEHAIEQMQRHCSRAAAKARLQPYLLEAATVCA